MKRFYTIKTMSCCDIVCRSKDGNIAYVYCACLWPKWDGPEYDTGFVSLAAFVTAGIICI